MNIFRFMPGYTDCVYEAGKEPLLLMLIAFLITVLLTRPTPGALLDVRRYDGVDDLIATLDAKAIGPAEELVVELRGRIDHRFGG